MTLSGLHFEGLCLVCEAELECSKTGRTGQWSSWEAPKV